MRILMGLGLLLWSGTSTQAQDMPLSQVLIEGETWKPRVSSKTIVMFRVSNRATTREGGVYSSDPDKKTIHYLPKDGKQRIVYEGSEAFSALVLWSDDGTLVAAPVNGKALVTFRITEDGGLTDAEDYYRPRLPSSKEKVSITDLDMDQQGRLYALSELGVQVFDPIGRLCGVILLPRGMTGRAVTVGTTNPGVLYLLCDNQVYMRAVKPGGRPSQFSKE